ncbi:hypothetical protein Leryth_012714 [Lithospermum erythrorhizon]|uniref:Uncharacterized protein n=1 Tax=Lithospermum erythrorhizon TaxID=34254 RepID=A0AAV3Q8A3_LITER|nr:hypothetical protein Leryth_012714 [Lithospermum erythrorhizon]
MKKSGFFATSAAAAAASFATVSASPSTSSNIQFTHQDSSAQESTSKSDKFAPRFDGLRFIETLVTAHR